MKKLINKTMLISVAALSSLALFSCGTTKETTSAAAPVETKKETGVDMKSIEGEWKLSKAVLSGVELPAVYPSTLIVTKEADGYMFAGNSGVNQYTGSVAIDADGNLTVTAPFASTKMAGPTEMMEFEDNFLKVLSFSGKVTVSDGTLELVDVQSESKLVFTK